MRSENDNLELRTLLALIRTLRATEAEAWANIDDCRRRVRERLQELLEEGTPPVAVAAYLQGKGVPFDEARVRRLAAPCAAHSGEVPQWWEVIAPGDERDVRTLLEGLTGMSVSTADAPSYRLALTPTEGRRLTGSLPHMAVTPLGA